ncbi:cbb3-type cytochrome c oxidase N-terminal domain-containing protein [Sulfuriroseicoccus oceanibius]|uniref:C-type cytochrome n=1 Tax=Sulfuriroseicoccus oceanibius TaxID=2707525 RepID=A0A6B3L999_9BACT|nr:cbb3-type cytochrome c oxidase N-terminal domain-containing protein [Sulfuriroseicoccus oceanibius]QQL46081.1 c-type cytochrome [Sulfuriroseicoccus oceanibius]
MDQQPNDPKNQDQKPSGDEPILMPHEYDGIQEFDQKLPNWWLWTFYITVIFFAVFWVLYYQVGSGATDDEKMENELDRIARIEAERLERELGVLSDAKLWEASRNTAFVEEGRKQFMETCAVCHGRDLSATNDGIKLSGVPLNDSEWLYGSDPMNVLNIVTNGSPDKTKGMQAWEPVLGKTRVTKVVAFVLSHHEMPEGMGEGAAAEGEASDAAAEEAAPAADPA